MASRSDRLYGDSPRVERDDNGKMRVRRGEKHEAKPKHDMGKMHERHARELAEMHKRHQDEHKALNERHEKEAADQEKMAAENADDQGGEDEGEPPASGAGAA